MEQIFQQPQKVISSNFNISFENRIIISFHKNRNENTKSHKIKQVRPLQPASVSGFGRDKMMRSTPPPKKQKTDSISPDFYDDAEAEAFFSPIPRRKAEEEGEISPSFLRYLEMSSTSIDFVSEYDHKRD